MQSKKKEKSKQKKQEKSRLPTNLFFLRGIFRPLPRRDEDEAGINLKRYVLRPDSLLARVIRKKHLFRPFFITTLLVLLLLLLSQLILAAIGYFFPRVRVVDWGTVEHGQWVKVLVIREEQLLTAPFTAELNLLVEEGTRIRAGEALAELIRLDASPGLNQEQRLALRTLASRLNQTAQEIAELEKDLAFLENQAQSPSGTQEQLQQVRAARAALLRTRAHLMENANAHFPAWTEYYQLVVADRRESSVPGSTVGRTRRPPGAHDRNSQSVCPIV